MLISAPLASPAVAGWWQDGGRGGAGPRQAWEFGLQLSDASWKRGFSQAEPLLAPLARLLPGKRGFGIHLRRTMVPF